MPELPEVETLRLGLQKYLVGHKIEDVEVKDRKVFEGDEKNAIGGKVKRVRRFGKGLVIDLNNGYSIAVHVKLTGQLICRDFTNKDLPVVKPSPQTVPNKFTRVVFKLKRQRSKGKSTSKKLKVKNNETMQQSNNAFLYFNDVRKFGWIKVLKTSEVSSLPFFKRLGPEPIPSPGSNTPKLTLNMFEKIVLSSNLPIKVLIMDQKRLSGVGNIYANDACFDAGIDPRRRAKSLSKEEIKKLYHSILKVLKKGLKYRGSTELNFVDVLGQAGEYQKHFLVYGREGEKCLRCGSKIKKIKLGGRGTYYCENCQD